MKTYYKKILHSLLVLLLLLGTSALFACEEEDVTSARVYEITLDRTSLSLDVGDSATLNASVLPEDACGLVRRDRD